MIFTTSANGDQERLNTRDKANEYFRQKQEGIAK